MREVREHSDDEELELVETTNTLVAGELGTVGCGRGKTIVLHSLLVMVFHLMHAVRIPFGSTVQNFREDMVICPWNSLTADQLGPTMCSRPVRYTCAWVDFWARALGWRGGDILALHSEGSGIPGASRGPE